METKRNRFFAIRVTRADDGYGETLVAVFVHQETLAGDFVARIFPIRVHETCALGDDVVAHRFGVCRGGTDVDVLLCDAAENAEKVAEIFDSILSKHEKKFRLSSLNPDARLRDWNEAFFWLKDSQVVNICFNATEPNIGLKMNEERTTMKCYMNDTGLLISHAFDERRIVAEDIYRKLLFGKLDVNEGMLMENIVAQMLVASGHKLYFFSKSSSEAPERMEIDFLIAKSKVTSHHNIIPLEVKSGKNYTFSSLNKFTTKYSGFVSMPTVLHPADLKIENNIRFLPVYMAGLV